MNEDLKSGGAAALAGWSSEFYGAPTETSEVSRVENFYRVEALAAFGTGTAPAECMAAESPELPARIAA